jgi:hypothetical protein
LFHCHDIAQSVKVSICFYACNLEIPLYLFSFCNSKHWGLWCHLQTLGLTLRWDATFWPKDLSACITSLPELHLQWKSVYRDPVYMTLHCCKRGVLPETSMRSRCCEPHVWHAVRTRHLPICERNVLAWG